MKHFVVTGASGYIGSHMCYELRQAYPDCKITAIDMVLKNKLNHLYDEFYIHDLSKTQMAVLHDRPDCVFHFASLASVPEGEQNPYLYYYNNINSSVKLIDEAIYYGVKNFIFSSSCAVYGSINGFINESVSKNPQSVYAKTKSIVEDILLAAETKGVRPGILRYFNAAGRNVEAGLYEEHEPETHLLPNIMKSNTIKIYGNDYNTHDGTAVRDYIHVVDICQAHIKAYEYMEQNDKGIICNLGTGKGHSVLDIVNLVQTITGKQIEVEYHGRRNGDVDRLVSDIGRMLDVLTFTPKHDIKSIISSLMI